MVLGGLQAVLAAMGAFAIVIMLCGCILCIFRSHKKTRPSHFAGPIRHTRSARDAAELSSISVDESATFDPSLRISMAVIVEATGQFSPDLIIGDGGFGWVYKAQLSPGVTVAIKKLSPDAFQGFREFRAEMETLGRLQHQNIVKMLGYCVSNTDRLLVYEFIEKGSLDLWLHDSSMESNGPVTWPSQAFEKFVPLSWPTRIKIMQGVAAGLAYLHGLPKRIIHRDIKASNVLLDRNFEAHIADFGLARRIDSSHTHVSTQVAGTMGYMPPEYKAGLTLATVEADVYSFGILMFEVATGKQPNLPITMPDPNGTKPKEVGLIEWARLKLKKGEAMEMIDPKISREAMVEAQVKEYFRIASLCTEESAKRRPAITEVQHLLNRVSSI